MPSPEKIFLSAEWQNLLMLNYEVDPACLQIYVPAGTELDSFDGKTYVSLVSHVPWKVWTATQAGFSGDTRDLYGEELSQLLKKNPTSAFIADGSPVKVSRGRALSS